MDHLGLGETHGVRQRYDDTPKVRERFQPDGERVELGSQPNNDLLIGRGANGVSARPLGRSSAGPETSAKLSRPREIYPEGRGVPVREGVQPGEDVLGESAEQLRGVEHAPSRRELRLVPCSDGPRTIAMCSTTKAATMAWPSAACAVIIPVVRRDRHSFNQTAAPP